MSACKTKHTRDGYCHRRSYQARPRCVAKREDIHWGGRRAGIEIDNHNSRLRTNREELSMKMELECYWVSKNDIFRASLSRLGQMSSPAFEG